MKPKLSIVVPVFNAEAYLDSCFDCLLAQGLADGDFEVIAVDDGSTDGSLSRCEAWAARMPQLRVLSQENAGAGAARNAGMDAACGDYLYFFDADDALEAGALAKLLARCEADALDVLFFAAELVYEAPELEQSEPQDPAYFERREAPGVRTGEELFIEQHALWNFCGQPCMLMSRLAFLREQQVRFPEGIVNEDNLFVLLATIHAARADVDGHKYYRYLVRTGSVTTDVAKRQKRVDAHFYLAREFSREYAKAAQAGKTELMAALAWLIDWFFEVAIEALGECSLAPEELTAHDPLSLSVYRRLLGPLGTAQRARAASEAEVQQLRSQVESLQAQLEHVRASTTWKLGSALTAIPRKVKDSRGGN